MAPSFFAPTTLDLDPPMLPLSSSKRKQQPQQQVPWMLIPGVPMPLLVVEQVAISGGDGQTPSYHHIATNPELTEPPSTMSGHCGDVP